MDGFDQYYTTPFKKELAKVAEMYVNEMIFYQLNRPIDFAREFNLVWSRIEYLLLVLEKSAPYNHSLVESLGRLLNHLPEDNQYRQKATTFIQNFKAVPSVPKENKLIKKIIFRITPSVRPKLRH